MLTGTQGDTTAADSPTAAPESTSAQQPSDTGAAQSSQGEQRSPIPYDRFHEHVTRSNAKYADLQGRYDRLQSQLQQRQQPSTADTYMQKMLAKMEAEERAAEEERFADPLERDFHKHRQSWEQQQKQYDARMQAMQERLDNFEVQRIQSQLQSEYDSAMKSGTFPMAQRYFGTEFGQAQLGQYLATNKTATMQEAFKAFEQHLSVFGAQQAGMAAPGQVAPAQQNKPTLHNPGSGASVQAHPQKPRTLEEAREATMRHLMGKR